MAYVRYHLAQLGLGEEVMYVQWSPTRKMLLPPLEEVPELRN